MLSMYIILIFVWSGWKVTLSIFIGIFVKL